MIGVYVSVDEAILQVETRSRKRLVVPVPPTTNDRLKGTVRKSKTGKRYQGSRLAKRNRAYQDAIRDFCATEGIKPFAGDVGMKITWYRSAKRGDVPDRWKDLCDALQANKNPYGKFGIYFDDSQIADWRVIRDDSDKNNPRCEIDVWRM